MPGSLELWAFFPEHRCEAQECRGHHEDGLWAMGSERGSCWGLSAIHYANV